MTEGHPSFVANNGRIGFGVDEHAAYAPEAGDADPPAVARRSARRRATSRWAPGWTRTRSTSTSWAPRTLDRFEAVLRDLGEDPADYRYLPVHPWQWEHRVAVTFAPDVARRDLVPLGTADDDYAAQQSIRTLFNTTRPDRHYVKIALAIQNMGFLRGLSPAYMRATPAINDWVFDLVSEDPTLARVRVPGAARAGVASATPATSTTGRRRPTRTARCSPRCGGRARCRWSGRPSSWRRWPRCCTVTPPGTRSSPPACGRRGSPAQDWVRRYLRAYLRPLVHCLLVHELAFMPHGENLILVLDGHAVSRVLMKDIGEEVAVLGDRPLPDSVARVRQVGRPPTSRRSRSSPTCSTGCSGTWRRSSTRTACCRRSAFWALVRECVDEHAADHPGLETAVDLRAERFAHSCLNRLQLRNTLQMVDLTDQSSSLIYAGTLANPIA